MGFERAPESKSEGVDSQDRRNGAVSWVRHEERTSAPAPASPSQPQPAPAPQPSPSAVPRPHREQVLHDEMLLELLSRIAPHVPLALHQHSPELAPPTAGELTRLEAISRLEAINLGGELARFGNTAGAAPLGGTAPWVRACAGAPEGVYTLSGLSARSRVYRYDADTPDAFKPHYDEVWPGSSLRLGGQGSSSNVMMYDGWLYSSDVQPHGHSALACSSAARVDAHRARGPPARPGLPSGPERSALAAWMPRRGYSLWLTLGRLPKAVDHAAFDHPGARRVGVGRWRPGVAHHRATLPQRRLRRRADPAAPARTPPRPEQG